MNEQGRTNAELIEENFLLKQRIKEIEQSESELKQTEEALHMSEERLRLAVNATKEGIWEMDLQTDKGFFSPRWCEIIGYSFDDPELPHTFDAWASRIHPDDFERVINARNNHIEHGTEYDVDYRHRHKSGEYRWQNTRGQLVLDNESGKSVKIVGCISDITKRKQAEEQLRESEARYQLLFNSSQDAIAILGGNPPTLLQVNPAFLQLCRYSSEEILVFSAEDMFHLVHPDDREMVKNRLHKRFRQEDVPHRYEYRVMTKECQVRWVEVSASIFYRNDQLFSQAIFRDITERKQVEEELKKYQRSLEDMVKERTEQLESKNITLHELNTALKVLLKRREDDEEDMEEGFVTNIQNLVLPYIEQIQKSDLNARQQTQLDIVAAHLREITTPFLKNLRQFNLTPKETKVAALIRQGKTTKEIAAILGLESSSIDEHRHNIRKKLSLSRSENLQSKLQTLK
jgi:PAS domain S-box-containing protein